MEEQLRVGKPVKSGKSHGLKHSRSKGSSKTRNDILPRGDEDNPDFDPLEQEEDVNDEVIQISSDDDSGEMEISSDDDGTVDATKGHKETANGEEGSRMELAKSLEAQISAMSLELECPVCLDVCAPPIYTCLAQHPVCSGCRSNLQECPMCSEPYKQRMMRHRYAERDFEKLEEAQRQLLALQDEKSHVEADGSLKRQATKLQTEYETQKKKLKMDTLTQQELKRKE